MASGAGLRSALPRAARARAGPSTQQARGDARPTRGWPPRWLTPVPTDDLARGDGEDIIEFITDHCRLSRDSVAGRKGDPLVLRGFQKEALRHIFARRSEEHT